uniref:Uncharacterized protein n=1 Tax=Onchocerca volvulus TaxID=6282 RepID=A0A8R1TS85_ONCVO
MEHPLTRLSSIAQLITVMRILCKNIFNRKKLSKNASIAILHILSLSISNLKWLSTENINCRIVLITEIDRNEMNFWQMLRLNFRNSTEGSKEGRKEKEGKKEGNDNNTQYLIAAISKKIPGRRRKGNKLGDRRLMPKGKEKKGGKEEKMMKKKKGREREFEINRRKTKRNGSMNSFTPSFFLSSSSSAIPSPPLLFSQSTSSFFPLHLHLHHHHHHHHHHKLFCFSKQP